MILGRFLMRLLLVPLGAGIAVSVATLVVILAHWNRFAAMLADQPALGGDLVTAIFFVGPALIWILSLAAVAMLLPASIGVLISEAFAIRSWIYHAGNGALSAWIGWFALADLRTPHEFYDQPLIVVGAGIASGFAYWAIAGWSAGFWKPVFAQAVPAARPPPAAPA
jgi:hypothetical protein